MLNETIENVTVESAQDSDKEEFFVKVNQFYQGREESLKKPWTKQRVSEVINDVKNGQVAERAGKRKTPSQYHFCSKYDVLITGQEEHLTFKRQAPEDPIRYILPLEDYYEKLKEVHASCGHGGRDKMIYALKKSCVIPKPVVEIFVSLCKVCLKKRSQPRKGLVSRPIVSKDFNVRGQVDLIDLQTAADGQYQWLMNYQDNATKFLHLRPLHSKRAVEVASELLKIFLEFGAPHILQSDNGREFVAAIIQELTSLWPECKIVHGRPRYPQSQGSVERSNQDVENMLRAWMEDNKSTRWSIGCYFVQWQKNSSFHRTIGRSPYRALFGCDPKVGLSSSGISKGLLEKISTEEDLEEVFRCEDEVDEVNSAATPSSTKRDSIDNYNSPTTSTEQNYPKCTYCDHQMEIEADKTEERSLCLNCVRESNISFERGMAHKSTKRAAEKMLENSNKKFPTLGIGSSITLAVPKVDRGPLDTRNIAGKIIDARNGVYSVGTAAGIIKNWFPRGEIQLSSAKFAAQIPEKVVSLREVVSAQSPFGGQGFMKCVCKPSKNQCCTKRCVCYKSSMKCNSKCHSSLTCANK